MPEARPLRDISDTALWAAVFRARETERPDALFQDPFARRLAGARGDYIAETMPNAMNNSWAWVMRTYVFDELITAQVNAGADTVINLAAGVDARPYRMALPASLKWYEIDLPAMISYKAEILSGEQPVCALERIPLDLRELDRRRELFRQLAQQSARAVVLSEGLLIYLSDEEVGGLARDLASERSIGAWIIDLASPALREMMRQTTGDSMDQASAPLRFSPPDGPEFFQRHGWNATEVHSILKTAVRTKRVPPELQAFAGFPEPPKPWAAGIWSGVCLLEKA